MAMREGARGGGGGGRESPGRERERERLTEKQSEQEREREGKRDTHTFSLTLECCFRKAHFDLVRPYKMTVVLFALHVRVHVRLRSERGGAEETERERGAGSSGTLKRRRPLTVPSFLPTGSSYTTPTQRPAGRSADHHTVSARAFKDSTDTFEDGRRAPRAGADSKHRRRGHAPGRSSPRKAISPAMPSTSTRSPTVIGAAIISSAPLHLRCRSEWRERSSISE